MIREKDEYLDDIDFKEDSRVEFSDSPVDDELYKQDLMQRRLYLNCDIDQDSVHGIIKNILRYNCDDKDIDPQKRKPILLYITSNGGEVNSSFELIDVIENSKTPVYTVNLGYQYSSGFLIGLAGARRYATKNSQFLMHDGESYIYNSGAKARDQMEFHNRFEERIKSYVLSKSKLSEEEYDDKRRVEWYLFADEAKQKGFVDYIIGEDCDINEVI